MRELFKDFPKAIDNTLAIGERCDAHDRVRSVEISGVFGAARGKTREEIFARALRQRPRGTLRRTCEVDQSTSRATGLRARRARENRIRQLLPDRLGFHPLRERSRNSGRAGPRFGRRFARSPTCSASRTSIRCNTDLLFERFLNPERVQPPDIDIDFCDDRRAEVIEYVRQKYGETSVAQIITFGTMGAKSRASTSAA